MYLSRYAEYETQQRDRLLAYHVTSVCVLKLQLISTNCVTVHNFYLLPEVGPPCCLRIVCFGGGRGGGRFALFLLHPLLPYAIRDVKNRRYYYVFSFAVHNKQVTTALYVAKILEHFFLTYCGPCIVIYLRNKDKQDALFSLNLFL